MTTLRPTAKAICELLGTTDPATVVLAERAVRWIGGERVLSIARQIAAHTASDARLRASHFEQILKQIAPPEQWAVLIGRPDESPGNPGYSNTAQPPDLPARDASDDLVLAMLLELNGRSDLADSLLRRPIPSAKPLTWHQVVDRPPPALPRQQRGPARPFLSSSEKRVEKQARRDEAERIRQQRAAKKNQSSE